MREQEMREWANGLSLHFPGSEGQRLEKWRWPRQTPMEASSRHLNKGWHASSADIQRCWHLNKWWYASSAETQRCWCLNKGWTVLLADVGVGGKEGWVNYVLFCLLTPSKAFLFPWPCRIYVVIMTCILFALWQNKPCLQFSHNLIAWNCRIRWQ